MLRQLLITSSLGCSIAGLSVQPSEAMRIDIVSNLDLLRSAGDLSPVYDLALSLVND